jgi:hypothetical protein
MKQVPNMHSGAKYLHKKNNSPSLSGNKTAPQQPRGVMPSAGVNNTMFESLNNTKGSGKSMPGAKSHAKVMGASPKKHGQYL